MPRFLLVLSVIFFSACQPSASFYDYLPVPASEVKYFRLWDQHYPESCFVYFEVPTSDPLRGELLHPRITDQTCPQLGIQITRVTLSRGFYALDYVGVPGAGKKCFAVSPIFLSHMGLDSEVRCVNEWEPFSPKEW